jgi:hypothetical protein
MPDLLSGILAVSRSPDRSHYVTGAGPRRARVSPDLVGNVAAKLAA